MIFQEPHHQLNHVLDQVAIELDIPPHKYASAKERFDAIKRHLEAADYPGSHTAADVYLQGSFRLGTVIRPIKGSKDCGFDIDIVCEVRRDKEGGSPEKLKNDVGEEVKGYARKTDMELPHSGKRCWALNYAPDSEGIGFHVDILPCLPDPVAGGAMSEGNFNLGATDIHYTQNTIAITDRDDDASPPKHEWRSSNPIGFASWFKSICDPGYAYVDNRQQKRLLFEIYSQRQNFPYRRERDIPDALVRTPLQRAIQIMKRHRDVRFSGHRKERYKPISMIITTLAARLYEGQASQYQTVGTLLHFIVETLARHTVLTSNGVLTEEIDRLRLIQRVGNKWYIPNPVNPHYPGDPEDKGENFADRWHQDNHAKANAFFNWVGWLRADLDALLNHVTQQADIEDLLVETFGDDIATRTLNRLGVEPKLSHAGLLARTRSTALSPFRVPHREHPRWAANLVYDVTVSGRYGRSNGWSAFASDCPPIPKGCDLMFTAQTDAPTPFDVYWQVVNTGTEAASHGEKALRGKILSATTAGVGGLRRKESTAYTGMHWVECFIVKNSFLVARSGPFVVNVE